MKKAVKILLLLLLAILLIIGGLLGWLSATESIAPGESAGVDFDNWRELGTDERALDTDNSSVLCYPRASAQLTEGAELEVLSWNIGYAGLGAGSGDVTYGGSTRTVDRAAVESYLAGIERTVRSGDYDVVLLQEVDQDSARSYGINEIKALCFGDTAYGEEYSCPFVPNPDTLLIRPIGKVESGVVTCSDYLIDRAERLPLPMRDSSWPKRLFNPKPCLLLCRLPIENSGKQLVLVNLHLDAFGTEGETAEQMKVLFALIAREYEKGNYVIAGGDFDQFLPGALEKYPITRDIWRTLSFNEGGLPEGFSLRYDLSVPGSRLLDRPYDPTDAANTQYYVTDGFLVSPNVTVEEVETLDLGFADSDHNPVRLSVRLGERRSWSLGFSALAETQTEAAAQPEDEEFPLLDKEKLQAEVRKLGVIEDGKGYQAYDYGSIFFEKNGEEKVMCVFIDNPDERGDMLIRDAFTDEPLFSISSSSPSYLGWEKMTEEAYIAVDIEISPILAYFEDVERVSVNALWFRWFYEYVTPGSNDEEILELFTDITRAPVTETFYTDEHFYSRAWIAEKYVKYVPREYRVTAQELVEGPLEFPLYDEERIRAEVEKLGVIEDREEYLAAYIGSIFFEKSGEEKAMCVFFDYQDERGDMLIRDAFTDEPLFSFSLSSPGYLGWEKADDNTYIAVDIEISPILAYFEDVERVSVNAVWFRWFYEYVTPGSTEEEIIELFTDITAAPVTETFYTFEHSYTRAWIAEKYVKYVPREYRVTAQELLADQRT